MKGTSREGIPAGVNTDSLTEGDCRLQVIELLKTGKGKEVSYNALATHIIAEDGDNPEVGESREVFDLPVIKVEAQLSLLPGSFSSQLPPG